MKKFCLFFVIVCLILSGCTIPNEKKSSQKSSPEHPSKIVKESENKTDSKKCAKPAGKIIHDKWKFSEEKNNQYIYTTDEEASNVFSFFDNKVWVLRHNKMGTQNDLDVYQIITSEYDIYIIKDSEKDLTEIRYRCNERGKVGI